MCKCSEQTPFFKMWIGCRWNFGKECHNLVSTTTTTTSTTTTTTTINIIALNDQVKQLTAYPNQYAAYPNHHTAMAHLYVQSMCGQICGTNSYCDSSLACVCKAGYEEDTTTTTA